LRSGFSIPVDIHSMHFTKGACDQVAAHEPEKIGSCVWFVTHKLAHHKEVKAGVTRQLPRYMDSIPCSHGVFIIMWFKDDSGRYFGDPKTNTLDETREFISKLAAKPKNAAHVITSRVIDCSVRPSASKLR
jgi:hypothetical protein